ncbi:MAG: hypothetical protein ABUK11_07180 [Mariprofundaceae bacterium]
MRFRITNIIPAIIAALMVSACATTGQHHKESVIGPYTTFSGRLIVIEPARRWQAVLNWDGTPEKGELRLTHAASNRIVKLSWHHDSIRILDNQSPVHEWRGISGEELVSNGIILPPQQLALILSGNMPKRLIQKKPGTWEGKLNEAFLRIKWSAEKQRLELMDITHGRKAILIIQP